METHKRQLRINNLSIDAKAEKLITACTKGKTKDIEEILECTDTKTFINKQKGFFLYAPLHNLVMSTCNEKCNMMELLLSHGANPSLQCSNAFTPLHLAASIGDVESIKVLLKFNADFTLIDDFNQTPLKTAENKNHKSAAMHLRTAETKLALRLNNIEPESMLHMRKGIDVTDACFDECLEITAELNIHLACGYLMLCRPDNVVPSIHKAIEHQSFETAAMLLLCRAAASNDHALIELICNPIPLDNAESIGQTFIAYQDIIFSELDIQNLRLSVLKIDHAFPISIGCRDKKYSTVKSLLFNLHLDKSKKAVKWRQLALNDLEENWFNEILDYKYLHLSENHLNSLPKSISLLMYLATLDIGRNKLETLPIQLFQDLPFLERLLAQGNRIKSLPNIEKWSSSIIMLRLDCNLLKQFPENTNGAKLEILDLANNQFTQIPDSICNIKTLQILDISRNEDVHVLPIQLRKLKNLRTLRIEGLKIRNVPLDLLKNTRHLAHHLRMKFRAAKSCYTMKLLLIGEAGVGKTTLLHRLKGDNDFHQEESTDGIDIHELNIGRGTTSKMEAPFIFHVWDFAGSLDYYATNQCFFPDSPLCLLLWDTQENEKGLWALIPWLDALVARLINCKIVLVGTKLDLVNENIQAFEKQMIKCAEEVLKSKKSYSTLHIIKEIFCTAKVGNKNYITRLNILRKEICKAAQQLTVSRRENEEKIMGAKIPSSYITLNKNLLEVRKNLLKDEKIPYINHADFLYIVRNLQCEEDTLEEDELEEAISFLKRVGTILHYDDPHNNLRDIYFISPSWLCRLVTSTAKIIAIAQIRQPKNKGILNIKDTHRLIGQEYERLESSFFPKYLRLLIKFQIVYFIDHEKILLPTALHRLQPKDLLENVHRQPLLLRYHVLTTSMPFGFFTRLLSHLLFHMNEMLAPRSVQPSHSPIQCSSGYTTFSEKFFHENLSEIHKHRATVKSSSCKISSDEGFAYSTVIKKEKCFSKSSLSFPSETITSTDISETITSTDISETIASTDISETITSTDISETITSTDISETITSTDISETITSADISETITSADISETITSADISETITSADISETTSADISETITSGDISARSKHECVCKDILAEEHIISGSGLFANPFDIAHLVDQNLLTYWQNGVVFDHPWLFFSIKNISVDNNRETIETKVSDSRLGYRVSGFILDHFNTLIREWYPILSTKDIYNILYLSQYIASPNCINDNIFPPQYSINPIHLFFEEKRENLIGKGGYSDVYRCLYKDQAAAIKVFNCPTNVVSSFEEFSDFRQELSILTKIKGHPFIVDFVGFIIQQKLCLVFELAEMGTLRAYISNETREINRLVIYRMILQISIALEFLHSKNIVHRDVKLGNVLLFSTDFHDGVNVKLVDFQSADLICPSGMKTFVGTPGYISPEVYEGDKNEYTLKVDIYSLAMLIYAILTCRRPFFQCESVYMIDRCVVNGDRPRFKDILKSMHGFYSLTEAMLQMWQQESNDRPTAVEVCDLMRQPSFQLLYGKRAMESEPRYMCFVENKDNVWIVCDDKKGSFIIIHNMVTAKVETQAINGLLHGLDTFNIVFISSIDETQVVVVLRGKFDVIIVLSTDERKKIAHHSFYEERIYSMAFTDHYVFLGFGSGKFSRILKKQFIEDRKIKEVLDVPLETMSSSVVGIITLGHHVVMSNDHTIFVYRISKHYLNNYDYRLKLKYPDQPIKKLVKCEDEDLFFVMFHGSAVIFLLDEAPLKILSKIDCSIILRRFIYESGLSELVVTCLCSFADVLWVGTNSGHILIYEHNQENHSFCFLFAFQPYIHDVTDLCLSKLSQPQDNVQYLIVSSGKILNQKLFGQNRFLSLGPNFPVDRTFDDSKTDSPFRPLKVVDDNTNVLLIWQGCNATVMKNILSYPY